MTAAIPRPNLLEGVPPDAWLRVCWAERPVKGGLAVCGGSVAWSKVAGLWRSCCGRCFATGRAAAGEKAALDAAHPDMGGVP